MTNVPSMTITSTAPAPEVGGSTSRKGKTIPLPMTEGLAGISFSLCFEYIFNI